MTYSNRAALSPVQKGSHKSYEYFVEASSFQTAGVQVREGRTGETDLSRFLSPRKITRGVSCNLTLFRYHKRHCAHPTTDLFKEPLIL